MAERFLVAVKATDSDTVEYLRRFLGQEEVVEGVESDRVASWTWHRGLAMAFDKAGADGCLDDVNSSWEEQWVSMRFGRPEAVREVRRDEHEAG